MFRSRRPGKPGETTQIPRNPAAGGPGHEGPGRRTIYARRTMIGPGWFDRRRRPAPAGRRPVRRPGRRRRHHRRRLRPRRRLPGPADGAGRAGRLRLGHVVEVLEAGPRRPALPPAGRGPARLRGPARAPAAARATPPTWSRSCPFLIPMFTGKDGVLNPKLSRALGSAMWMYDLTGGARIGKLHKRISRRRGDGPHADAAPRPAGRVVPLLRRPGRRRPPHARPSPAPPPSTTARRSPTAPAWSRSHKDRRRRAVAGATVEADGERFEVALLVRSSTPAACGPTTCAPSTRAPTPTRSGRPRASTSPCRGSSCATTSPSWSPSRATSARCSSCRGATSPTSAPPTPTTTARSTTRSAPPRTSTTCCGRSTSRPRAPSPTSDVIGTWAGLRPLVKRASSGRTADLSRRHKVAHVGVGRGHRHRRQAHDLPRDGRRHGRRGRRRPRRPRADVDRRPAAPSASGCGAPRATTTGRDRRRRASRPPRRPLRRRGPRASWP